MDVQKYTTTQQIIIPKSATPQDFITEAASASVKSRDVMTHTGHKSKAVMRGYIRDAGLGAGAAVKAAFREE